MVDVRKWSKKKVHKLTSAYFVGSCWLHEISQCFFFVLLKCQYIAGNGYPWQQQIMIRRCTDEQVLLDFCRNNVFLLWDSPFYEFCNGMDTPSELTFTHERWLWWYMWWVFNWEQFDGNFNFFPRRGAPINMFLKS